MLVGVTAHRPQSIDNDFSLTSPKWEWISKELKGFFEDINPTVVVTGMALGGDMLAAEVAFDLDIKVRAVIPFEGQESLWEEDQKKRYHEILKNCFDVFYTAEGGYANWKLHARNHFIVDNTNVMCAIWNGGYEGGTGSTVKYAEKREKPIYQINPNKEYSGWKSE